MKKEWGWVLGLFRERSGVLQRVVEELRLGPVCTDPGRERLCLEGGAVGL